MCVCVRLCVRLRVHDNVEFYAGLTRSKQHPGFGKLRLTSRPCLAWPRILKGLSLML